MEKAPAGRERPRLCSPCGLEQWSHSGANVLIVTTYGVSWFSPQSDFGPHELDWCLCSRQASAELQSLMRTQESQSQTGPHSHPHVGWGSEPLGLCQSRSIRLVMELVSGPQHQCLNSWIRCYCPELLVNRQKS